MDVTRIDDIGDGKSSWDERRRRRSVSLERVSTGTRQTDGSRPRSSCMAVQ